MLWYIHPRGLGYGDVRLSGILGIALGWVGYGRELVVGIYAAFLLGGVGGALLSRLRIVDRKGFPFGPFMFVGPSRACWSATGWPVSPRCEATGPLQAA